jgi:hypothetical protein
VPFNEVVSTLGHARVDILKVGPAQTDITALPATCYDLDQTWVTRGGEPL